MKHTKSYDKAITNADVPVHYPQLGHVPLTNAVRKLFESWLMVLYELYRLPYFDCVYFI